LNKLKKVSYHRRCETFLCGTIEIMFCFVENLFGTSKVALIFMKLNLVKVNPSYSPETEFDKSKSLLIFTKLNLEQTNPSYLHEIKFGQSKSFLFTRN